MRREPSTPIRTPLSLVGSSVGRLFAELGAEPVVAEAWSSLAGVAHLSTLSRILRALTAGAVDVVIVDCGDHRRARELVELPSVLERLLDAALTPRLAMWRSTGSAGEAAVFDAVSSARHEVVRMRQALEHPATSLRLVTPPTTASVDRTVVARVGVRPARRGGRRRDRQQVPAQGGRLAR